MQKKCKYKQTNADKVQHCHEGTEAAEASTEHMSTTDNELRLQRLKKDNVIWKALQSSESFSE